MWIAGFWICKVNARLRQGFCKVGVLEWYLTDDRLWNWKDRRFLM